MRLFTGMTALILLASPAFAQDAAPKLRQPKGAPQAAKPEPKKAEGGNFDCRATSVRVSNLPARGPSPVALPGIYARPFVGTCEQAEKRAKAMPSQDTNYVILGRTTPIEMAAGLCQSGAGNRTISRGELKPTRGGFVKSATKNSKDSVVITRAMKYTLTSVGSGFSYTLSGSCKPLQPLS